MISVCEKKSYRNSVTDKSIAFEKLPYCIIFIEASGEAKMLKISGNKETDFDKR